MQEYRPAAWRPGHRLARPVAIATFGLHALIMLILQISYRDVVAIDSIVAMTVRMAVWIIILMMLYMQARRKLSP